MMRLWKWLRAWWGAARAVHAVDAAMRRCDAAYQSQLKSTVSLDDRRAELAALRIKMDDLERRMTADMQQAAKSFEQYEQALDNVRAELEVARDITIPTLTAAHKLLLQRYEAEIAVQVRRQYSPTAKEEI